MVPPVEDGEVERQLIILEMHDMVRVVEVYGWAQFVGKEARVVSCLAFYR